MMEYYYNQNVTWKSKVSVSDTNEATYAPDASIPCRVEYGNKMTRNTAGQEVISLATIFTGAAVEIDDIIFLDGIKWPVISVAKEADLFGNVLFREVRL